MSTGPRPPLTRCPACGREFGSVLAGGRPPDRCPGCGTPLDRPYQPPADTDRHLLAEGTTADDGRAYAVFGDKPVPRCPSCDKPLDTDAPACPHCNWNRDAGRRLPRTYEPVRRQWDSGWPLPWRVVAFALCQAINVATIAWSQMLRGNAPVTVAGWAVASAVQAFVLGTFGRLVLERTAKGKVTLTLTWRIAFVPLTPNVIRWREYEGVVVRHSEVGVLDWWTFFLLLPTIVPALLFWWFAIRPGWVQVSLAQNLGDPVTTLYAGTDTERAVEIAEAVRDLTGLPYDPIG